jgi:hypothetical protein
MWHCNVSFSMNKVFCGLTQSLREIPPVPTSRKYLTYLLTPWIGVLLVKLTGL